MKFVITEQVPCVQQWTYEVEAASETEALELVLNGKAQMIDSIVTEHDYEHGTYEIEDENGDTFDVSKSDDDLVELEREEMEEDDNTQDDDDEDFLSSIMYGVDNKQ